MRRQTVYVGQVPLETDILNTNKNVMIALGHVLQDMLGTSTLFSGLGCVPTSPAGMTVNVNAGRAYSYQATDAGAYSSLPADAHQILKQGIILDATNFSCPAPTTAGFSINYLVQAAFQEIDGGSTVLPYYNASNPAQAYNGPNGTGTSQSTYRDNTVQLSLKAGTAATTGSQITPTPDAGFNGLWVITVPYGATSITSGNIAQYSSAPFLSSSLLNQIQNAPNGVVGLARNASMLVSAAAATATFTADEIILGTALGGQMFKLSNFSQTINLGTTGAGGMDTGVAPTSGWVALYAIANPLTGARSMIAVDSTSIVAPSVYGGANMPAGYTVSALQSVWPTTSGKLFGVGLQSDRSVSTPPVLILNTTTQASSPTALSISGAVPPNAKSVTGNMLVQSSVSTAIVGTIAASVSGIGGASFSNAASSVYIYNPFTVPINASQTIFRTATIGSGTLTNQATVVGYTF